MLKEVDIFWMLKYGCDVYFWWFVGWPLQGLLKWCLVDFIFVVFYSIKDSLDDKDSALKLCDIVMRFAD